jgi:hypothetical protein
MMIALLAIAVQDFKFRAVYWWLFPVLMSCLALVKGTERNFALLVQDFLSNIVFLSVQFLFLSVYFSLKERRMVNILNGYLGLGDVLFLIAITAYFSFLNYLVFYLATLFGIIAISLFVKWKYEMNEQKIPLAGYQAVIFIFWIAIAEFSGKVCLTADDWLVNYLKL